MRNRLLLGLAVAAAAASSVFADSKDFTINKTNTIVNFESGDYDYNIYYSGTANTRARLGIANAEPAKGYTVRSLTLKAGDGSTSQTPSEWNLLGCFTLNIPTASGEYTVLKNETEKNIHYQMGELTIGNADSASKATALVDLGGGFLRLMGGGVSDQNPTLNVNTSTRITSTNTTAAVNLNSASILNVNGTSTLDVGGAFTSSGNAEKRSKINIAQDAKLKVASASLINSDIVIAGQFSSDGSVVLDRVSMTLDGSFSAAKKKTITLKADTVVSGGGLFDMSTVTNINEGASVDIRAISTGAGFLLDVAGSLKTSQNTTYNNLTVSGTLEQTAGDQTVFNRAASFKAGSAFKTASNYVRIQAGTVDAAYTTLSIGAANKSFVVGSENAKIDIQRGTILLGKAQAIRDANGGLVSISTRNDTTKAELRLNASNDFATITALKNNLDVFVADGSILSADFAASDGGLIILHDFVDNSVFVKNYESIADLSTIFEAYKTIDGVETKIDTIYCNNGWLSTTAVPEPAEWAAIFGAIALAAAVCRRRK